MTLEKVWILFAFSVLLTAFVTSEQVPRAGGSSGRRQTVGHGLAHKVTIKHETLNGLKKRSEFNANWRNATQDNNWYSKTPNSFGLNFHHAPQDLSPNVNRKSTSQEQKTLTLTEMLFADKGSLAIAQLALESKFVTEMAQGVLHVELYRNYMIQDIVYLSNAAKLYAEAAQTMQTNLNRMQEDERYFETVGFYWEQAKKFEGYYKDYLNTWQLREADKLQTGPAVEMYMGFQRAVMKRDPVDLVIAMLPCSMLYPWLVSQAESNIGVLRPTYKQDWFDKNRRNSAGSTERFVNRYFRITDENQLKHLLNIFVNGMQRELDFFLEAGKQGRMSFSQIRNLS